MVWQKKWKFSHLSQCLPHAKGTSTPLCFDLNVEKFKHIVAHERNLGTETQFNFSQITVRELCLYVIQGHSSCFLQVQNDHCLHLWSLTDGLFIVSFPKTTNVAHYWLPSVLGLWMVWHLQAPSGRKLWAELFIHRQEQKARRPDGWGKG